jgi:hypothetical protein
MRAELRQLVLSGKPVNEYTTAELIDCLFEPVAVYVEECDPDKHLYFRKESRELDMGQKFYYFRADVKDELKRRTR